MITKSAQLRNLTLPVLGIMLGLAAVMTGRALAESESPQSSPAIGELRAAPNVNAMPAAPRLGLAELAGTADAIGLVQVDAVQPVVDAEWTSEMTGLTNRWGRGVVAATVQRVIVGDTTVLGQFTFPAIFIPGTLDFAVPASGPPLEVGREYLVFIRGGSVYVPGGTYLVHDGAIWDIGHWDGPESRSYPDDLSGLTVGAATERISASR